MLKPLTFGNFMSASDGISAGGLFRWKLTISNERAYSLKIEDYPRLPLVTRKGPYNSTIFFDPVFWLVFDELSTWSHAEGVCRNCTAGLTTWSPLPKPSTTQLLRRCEGPLLHSARLQRFPGPGTWQPTLLVGVTP